MTNVASMIETKTAIAPIWRQMQDITKRKKEQIKKIDSTLLSDSELAAKIEQIRTEPVFLNESYELSKRPINAKKIVSTDVNLKRAAVAKTVITGIKHEKQSPITLQAYLEALYLSTSGYRDGGISMMYKRSQKILNDFSHPTSPDRFERVDATIRATRMVWDIKSLIRHTHLRRTLYHSLNTFNKCRRVKEDIRQIHACYVDIDCYKAGYSQLTVVEDIYEMVVAGKIPEPSFIVYSGRGVYGIWLLHDAPGTERTKKYYDVVQDQLVQHFDHLGADNQAKAINGYIRLPGSYHPVAGKMVEIVHHDTSKRYTLTEFGVAIGAGAPSNVVKMDKSPTRGVVSKGSISVKKSKNKLFNQQTYQAAFQRDMLQLLFLRKFHMYKCRNLWLYMMHHSLLRYGYDLDIVMDKLLVYNDKFQDPLPHSEVYDLVESSYKRYLEWVDQQEQIINGTWQDEEGKYRYKGYNWSTSKIITAFEITIEEMEHLKLFVDLDLKKKRRGEYEEKRKSDHNEKRRKKRRNEKNLTAREASKREKITAIKTLLQQGYKQTEIVKQTGFSKSYVSEIVKQIRNESKQSL